LLPGFLSLGTPDAEVYDLTSHESLDTAVRQSNVAHAKALSYLMRALLLRQAAQAVVSHSRVSFNRLVLHYSNLADNGCLTCW